MNSYNRDVPPGVNSDRADNALHNLERMLKLILSEKGPMPFALLLEEVHRGLSIQPGTLHDTLNNLIASGSIQIAPTGFYLSC